MQNQGEIIEIILLTLFFDKKSSKKNTPYKGCSHHSIDTLEILNSI